MGKFESVWVDFKGEEKFAALKKELFGLYGRALDSEEHAKKIHKKAGIEPSEIEPGNFLYAWGVKIQMSGCHIPRIATRGPLPLGVFVAMSLGISSRSSPLRNS